MNLRIMLSVISTKMSGPLPKGTLHFVVRLYLVFALHSRPNRSRSGRCHYRCPPPAFKSLRTCAQAYPHDEFAIAVPPVRPPRAGHLSTARCRRGYPKPKRPQPHPSRGDPKVNPPPHRRTASAPPPRAQQAGRLHSRHRRPGQPPSASASSSRSGRDARVPRHGGQRRAAKANRPPIATGERRATGVWWG